MSTQTFISVIVFLGYKNTDTYDTSTTVILLIQPSPINYQYPQSCENIHIQFLEASHQVGYDNRRLNKKSESQLMPFACVHQRHAKEP
ncbi:MAG: hypothetical protein N2235_08530 [Fischerella sp.]|nr:hypothetical protein [Fischerella sp.]